MQFHFVLMEEADARAIMAWRYERAIRVYERAGFERTGIYMQVNPVNGHRDFVEMRRRA